jgi:hypothetical protein
MSHSDIESSPEVISLTSSLSNLDISSHIEQDLNTNPHTPPLAIPPSIRRTRPHNNMNRNRDSLSNHSSYDDQDQPSLLHMLPFNYAKDSQ